MPEAWLVFTILSASLWSSQVWAKTQPLTQFSSCMGDTFAQRTGQNACWTKWTVGTRTWLCLSRHQWVTWLENPDTACRTWYGKWKLGAPLFNRNSELEKPIFRSFKTTFPLSTQSYPFTIVALTRMLRAKIEAAREGASDLIRKHDSTGSLRLLVTGEKTPGGGCELLRRIGFLHLLTASGIHLYALARWVDFATRHLLYTFSVPLTSALQIARATSGAIWILGWLLCGARLGMFRPWLLIALNRTARLSGFQWRKWIPLTLTILIDFGVGSLRKDESLSGRWIYLLAVAGATLTRGHTLKSHFAMAFSSWVFVALWEAHEDHLVSIAAPWINIISAPLLSGLIYPLLILSTILNELGLNAIAAHLAEMTTQIGSTFIENTAALSLRFHGIWTTTPISVMTAIGTSAVILSFFREKLKTSVCAVVLILTLLRLGNHAIASPSHAWPSSADGVFQLDIGQGDSALVYWGNPPHRNAGLIDTGAPGAFSPVEWIKLFSRLEISRLDWILLTHLDQDHAGGTQAVAAFSKPRCILTSEQEWNSPRGQKFSEKLSKMSLHKVGTPEECIPFPVYRPPKSVIKKSVRNANMSAVLIPLNGGGFYLSAGDATEKDELKIGKWAQSFFKSVDYPRILKISHHGSKTSTSAQFLEQVKPTEVWISSGVGNSYGHPHEKVLHLLKTHALSVKRTDVNGILSYRGRKTREAAGHHLR